MRTEEPSQTCTYKHKGQLSSLTDNQMRVWLDLPSVPYGLTAHTHICGLGYLFITKILRNKNIHNIGTQYTVEIQEAWLANRFEHADIPTLSHNPYIVAWCATLRNSVSTL